MQQIAVVFNYMACLKSLHYSAVNSGERKQTNKQKQFDIGSTFLKGPVLT